MAIRDRLDDGFRAFVNSNVCEPNPASDIFALAINVAQGRFRFPCRRVSREMDREFNVDEKV